MTAPNPHFFQSAATPESTRTQTLAVLKNKLEQQFKIHHMSTQKIRSIYIKLSNEGEASQQGTQHLFKPLRSHHQTQLMDLDAQMHDGLIEAIARILTLEKLPNQALNNLFQNFSQEPQYNGPTF
jgi:hypothetical protein